ncbi:hypothetical protein PIB30_045759 [Stylosanthes scabra]|uniref:Uncharacterized protein n=1 Tax=Stylosanthes scabra TaxID=79078 RepID=A0ABU6SGX3_9FABA|nr:hypothetical protein [Stylosanthes scabra]
MSQPDPPTAQVKKIPITWDGQKGFDPDNNVRTQEISNVIELMLNEPWIMYSEIPADVQKRWFEKWVEKFMWPEEQKDKNQKVYDHRAGKRYQQIMQDVRDGELQRLRWLSEMLRRQLLHRFATDPGFLKHRRSTRQGHWIAHLPSQNSSARPTHGSVSILEKYVNDLLTEFSANFELCLTHTRTEFVGLVDSSPHLSAPPAMEVHLPPPPALRQVLLLRRLRL